jgi:hypothetical protein
MSKDLQDKINDLKERENKADLLLESIIKERNLISQLVSNLIEKQKPLSELKKKKDLSIKLQTSIPYLKELIWKNKKQIESAPIHEDRSITPVPSNMGLTGSDSSSTLIEDIAWRFLLPRLTKR